MTTVHMDIEAVRRIQHDLEDAREQIQDRLRPLKRINQNLHADWIATSANEYASYFNDIESRLSRITDRLDEIASGLSAEIANYENMDKKLG